jgi:hypothetical protein
MKPYKLKVDVLTANRTRGPAVRYQAVIRPSIKRGIRVHRQKTFLLKTIAPEFTSKQMMPAIEAELDRWATKQLSSAANGGLKGVA